MFVQWRMAIQPQRWKRAGVSLVGAAALAAALTGCSHVPGVYTYVPAGEATASGGGNAAAFDAKAYVEKNWAEKVLPAVEADAVDASTLLPALAADQVAASKQYGYQAGTGSPYAFLTRGSGTVTKVDEENPSHPLTIQLDGTTGKDGTVQVVTGPVIAGTALRDGVKFIHFSDFTNQLDYADVGTELNTKVKTEVLAALDPKGLVGTKVDFAGAFSLVAPGSILVVPTQLEPAS
jgi:predicted lipoprotein